MYNIIHLNGKICSLLQQTQNDYTVHSKNK